MGRRGGWALAAGVGVAVLALLVLAGRWERARWVHSQVRGMERVRAAIGPLDSPRLVGYRVLPQFDCLVYRRGAVIYSLELCVDGTGRVVEAIERRPGLRRYWSLRSDPAASTFRVDRAAVVRLLRKMRAPGF